MASRRRRDPWESWARCPCHDRTPDSLLIKPRVACHRRLRGYVRQDNRIDRIKGIILLAQIPSESFSGALGFATVFASGSKLSHHKSHR